MDAQVYEPDGDCHVQGGGDGEYQELSSFSSGLLRKRLSQAAVALAEVPLLPSSPWNTR